MRVIGITGGIGSGKTAVTDYLSEKGYILIDADVISRQETETGAGGLKAIVEEFGRGVLLEDGSLNRKLLADTVFSDEIKREKLNAIIHVRVIQKTRELIQAYSDSGMHVVFLTAPLLIEAGMQKLIHELWLICAAYDIRMRRVLERDQVDEDHVKKRMAAQMPTGEKMKYAQVIIDNSGSLTELYRRVDRILAERNL
jgi:dephospho-CoA kinase